MFGSGGDKGARPGPTTGASKPSFVPASTRPVQVGRRGRPPTTVVGGSSYSLLAAVAASGGASPAGSAGDGGPSLGGDTWFPSTASPAPRGTPGAGPDKGYTPSAAVQARRAAGARAPRSSSMDRGVRRAGSQPGWATSPKGLEGEDGGGGGGGGGVGTGQGSTPSARAGPATTLPFRPPRGVAPSSPFPSPVDDPLRAAVGADGAAGAGAGAGPGPAPEPRALSGVLAVTGSGGDVLEPDSPSVAPTPMPPAPVPAPAPAPPGPRPPGPVPGARPPVPGSSGRPPVPGGPTIAPGPTLVCAFPIPRPLMRCITRPM
jgi:hypothetical protein